MNDEQIKKFESLPASLKAERSRLLELSEEMQAAERGIAEQEQQIGWAVAMEKTPDGTALAYKNEMQRMMETQKRLNLLETYKLQKKTLLNRGVEIERKKIDIQFLQETFRMFETLAALEKK